MSILKKIFSVDMNYSEERFLLTVFGLKLKIQKAEYARRRKTNPYYYYKKNNIDITTIPPATGQIREIQLAALSLLKEFDYVCKQNNIQYWLEFGTLIGAVRHHGFIPWDDDIDLSVTRKDYERLVDTFNNTSRNPDIYAEYTKPIIRIKYKKSEHIYMDIFPYDKYGKIMDTKEEISESKKLKNLRYKVRKRTDKLDLNGFLKEIEKTRKEIILVNEIPSDTNQLELVRGFEVSYAEKNWFSHYTTIFPLKTIEFEGCQFGCVNNPDKHLRSMFGNYMDYPSKIGCGHNMYKDLSQEEQNALRELIEYGSKI